jgi:hypothetical protein
MAQKIEPGFSLEDDDARRFEEYVAKPDITPEGRVRAHRENPYAEISPNQRSAR